MVNELIRYFVQIIVNWMLYIRLHVFVYRSVCHKIKVAYMSMYIINFDYVVRYAISTHIIYKYFTIQICYVYNVMFKIHKLSKSIIIIQHSCYTQLKQYQINWRICIQAWAAQICDLCTNVKYLLYIGMCIPISIYQYLHIYIYICIF